MNLHLKLKKNMNFKNDIQCHEHLLNCFMLYVIRNSTFCSLYYLLLISDKIIKPNCVKKTYTS